MSATKNLQASCEVAGIDQTNYYIKWMLTLTPYSIVEISTGKIIPKGEIFNKYYHKEKDVLKLFTQPITEDGDIMVPGYKLVTRKLYPTKQAEDEVLSEIVDSLIRKKSIQYLCRKKLNVRDEKILISYDQLLDLLTVFGKSIFDKHEKLNELAEASFVPA